MGKLFLCPSTYGPNILLLLVNYVQAYSNSSVGSFFQTEMFLQCNWSWLLNKLWEKVFWVSVHHMTLKLHSLASRWNWLETLALFPGACFSVATQGVFVTRPLSLHEYSSPSINTQSWWPSIWSERWLKGGATLMIYNTCRKVTEMWNDGPTHIFLHWKNIRTIQLSYCSKNWLTRRNFGVLIYLALYLIMNIVYNDAKIILLRFMMNRV